MTTLVFMYLVFSCLGCGLAYAFEECLDTDKAIVAFFYGLLLGWAIIPIKFVKGLKKYIKGE